MTQPASTPPAKIKARSPEMIELIHATLRFYDELGLDDQPEIYEFASQSTENARKEHEIFRNACRSILYLKDFFEDNFDSSAAFDSYEAPPLRTAASEKERIDRLGDVYYKAINNWKERAKDD